MFKEFRPRRPETQSGDQSELENRLRERRLNNTEGPLAHAIEMLKEKPGVKHALGVQESQIGMCIENGKTFLPTGQIFWDASDETPTKSIDELKKIKVMSVNLGRFGESENRDASKEAFLKFVQDTFLNSGHVLTLQDFRFDRDTDVLSALQKMGLNYVASVFGQSKSDSGEMMELANVTILNPKMFQGYRLQKPNLSVTPNFQRVRRNGKYINAEPRWDLNYANEEDYLRKNHFAFQALNTEITIEGSDGTLPLHIGNLYNAPSSQMVDRIASIKHSIENINTSNGFQVLLGDFNLYGVDSARKIFGKTAFPVGIGIHTVIDTVAGRLPEKRFLQERLKRQAKYHMSQIGQDGNSPTIRKGPGKILGLQVDGVVARKDLKTKTETLKVPFSDHEALVTEVNFI